MKRNSIIAGFLAAVFVGTGVVAPLSVEAQTWRDKESKHRQETKNNWRNIAIGSGALGVYGLVKKDTPLSLIGAAGTIYSLQRYEHDRRSQSSVDRARARAYSQRTIRRNGHRYVRKTVKRNGKRYYTYVRG